MLRSSTTAWSEWFDEQCGAVRAADRWRAPRSFDAAGPAGVLVDGPAGPVVSFASNDYLGLSQHPAVKAAAVEAIERWGTGSGASRLVVGSRPAHHDIEDALAAWKGAEAAVLFPTGFAANTGLLGVLGAPGVRICSDALNHASIVDGCRLARERGAALRVYPHADLDALDAALAEAGAERLIVVSDNVFSMDGDQAPIDGLVDRCAAHGALLVLDDAHPVLPGRGVDDATVVARAAERHVELLRVGTLSKALGAMGGFVVGRQEAVDLLVNRARSYIFTTAPTPAATAAALAALEVVRSREGDELRARLRDNVDQIRDGHSSPIVPVVLGDERVALEASQRLLDAGLLVPAIRPPTVPAGTSRLRVALSAAHTVDQVARLREALAVTSAP